MTTQMESRIAALEERVARLEDLSTVETVIEFREITTDEARAEIIDLFATGETLYYSDISERLRIGFDMVVDICRELQQEEAIGVDDQAV